MGVGEGECVEAQFLLILRFTEDEDLELKRCLLVVRVPPPPHPLQCLSCAASLVALHRLHASHGNTWKLIGDRLDRSAEAVRRRYLYIKRKEKTG